MIFPGGKGGVYRRLINMMPPHEVFIETHLGGGAVMRNKRPAKKSIGIEIDPDVLCKWSVVPPMNNFELVQSDAVTFLKKYPFTGQELVYCDPPYVRETRRKKKAIYKHEYTQEQHIELLETIKSLPCMVMISGYRSTLYTDRLKEWHSQMFQAKTHKGVATEWIWMNYNPPVKLHDYQFLGENFRERERIQKKSKRWVAKLETMPVLERQGLLSAIQTFMEKTDNQ